MLIGYRRGALVIDAGSAAFSKYVDGGIRKDWHRRLQVAAPGGATKTGSVVGGLAAELYFPYDTDPGGIQTVGGNLEIRFTALPAVKNQLVSVFLNEKKLGDLRMEKAEWKSYSMSAPPDSFRNGENKLRFYFRSTGTLAGHESAAAFARFVIGGSISDDDVFKAGIQVAGGSRRQALKVSAASRLSAYVLVPEHESQLAFSFVGKGKASVWVRAAAEAESTERWTQKATEDKWADASVDLARYRGQLVRFDLLSEDAMSWASLRVTAPMGDTAEPERPTPKHIILWSVSSLRADRLRTEVGRGFRRFTEESFQVRGAQSNVPAAGGAHATAMTGRMRVRSSIPETYTTLAERLREAGYATALVSGNGFVTKAGGYAQGFDHYDNPMRRQHHFGAKTLWRLASRFLEKHKGQRTFIHIVTVEPHIPYRPTEASLAREWFLPAPFGVAKTLSLGEQIANGRRVMTANEKAYIRALYDASVADAGAAFTAMLDELEELGRSEDTAVILSGDHGEEMWERGNFGHGASLYQESLLTPFAARAPGLPKQVADRAGSLIDLMPTILALAGLEPGIDMQGQSLLSDDPSLATRPLAAAASDGSRSLQWGGYKLMQFPSGTLHLFDLDRDPGEQEDISQSRPLAARALRNLLSISIAYESAWSTARWGHVSSVKEAFARDQGM
jgi:arylsulfatase